MGLLDCMAVIFWTFWGTAILFSKVVQPKCMRVLVSPYPYVFFSVFLIVAILNAMRRYLSVAFICISLMIGDIKHLFMCVLTIHISFLERCLFKPFAHFWTGLFVHLLLTFKCSLYILDINPLSDTLFAYIFSHSVDCLFTLWLQHLLIGRKGSLTLAPEAYMKVAPGRCTQLPVIWLGIGMGSCYSAKRQNWLKLTTFSPSPPGNCKPSTDSRVPKSYIKQILPCNCCLGENADSSCILLYQSSQSPR